MKNLKEVTEQLEIEIKNKKRDLAILKTDQMMRDLTINDLAEFKNINAVTKYYYLNVYPRVPLREKNTSKIMCRCLGNVEKLTDKKILVRKTEAVAYFKQRWAEMRKDFELLKDFS
jgi:hypothetical protein